MARSAADTARFTLIEVIAVVAGAFIGLLLTALFGWLFLSVLFGAIAASVGYYVLALVTVAIFAALYATLPGTPATLASLAIGILLPTLIVRFSFDATQPLGTLLLLHLVFAIVALSVYRFVRTGGLSRGPAAPV